MRIGLHLGPQNEFVAPERMLDFVRRAEDLGFDPITFADTVSLARFHARDPYVYLALAAGATRTATIGTCVTNPLTRHLSVTANAIASIDDLCPGRTVLGIGTGDTAVHLVGLERARLGPMREALEVLRGLLDGTPVEHRGARLTSNWRKPELPIFLAAGGPATLALGGELANGVITLAGLDQDVLAYVRAGVAEGEARAGRTPGSTPIWVDGLVSIGPERQATRDAIRPRIASLANHNFRVAFHGVPDERLAEVRAFREAYDETDLGPGSKNARLVTDYMLDRFGIVGTPADAIARFETLAEQGVETFLIAQPFTQAEREVVLETVGREVIPRVGC